MTLALAIGSALAAERRPSRADGAIQSKVIALWQPPRDQRGTPMKHSNWYDPPILFPIVLVLVIVGYALLRAPGG